MIIYYMSDRVKKMVVFYFQVTGDSNSKWKREIRGEKKTHQ